MILLLVLEAHGALVRMAVTWIPLKTWRMCSLKPASPGSLCGSRTTSKASCWWMMMGLS